MSDTHRGQCFFGAIEIEVTGEPESIRFENTLGIR